MSAITTPPLRFENPTPFRFTREQYHKLAELGFFGNRRTELLFGEIIEKYPNDPVDPSPRPFRFTREQYHKLAELGFFNGHRVELLFGEIADMSPINWPHVVGCRKVADFLERTFAGTGWIGRGDPIEVGEYDPQPDVAVFPGRLGDYTNHPKTALLIVEVSDATLHTDLTAKAELYATAGVPEYWVLDLNGRVLYAFSNPVELPKGLGATAYRKQLVHAENETVSPQAAPNASIRVSELLP